MSLEVEVGQIIENKIVDISFDGKAVLKQDNLTIFTDSGVIGDVVKVEIEKLKKSYVLAKTIEIVEKSPHRIESRCEYSNVCGGCQFQDFDYDEELKLKKSKVRNDLERIGKIQDYKLYDTIGAEELDHYRNNIQMPIMKSKGKAVIGYFEKASHRIVDIDKCLIQEEIAGEIIKSLKEFIEEENVSCYNRRDNKGLLRHVIIRTSKATKEAMVILVINGKDVPNLEVFVSKLMKIKEVTSLYLNVNKERTNLVTGDKYKLVFGEKKITDKIGNLEYKISPQSFFQVNTKQAEKLYEKVAEFANLSGDEVVVDLYSGIGTIGLYLADKAKEIVGVEVVERAVMDAKLNAKINNIENAKFFEGTSEKMLPVLEQVGIVPDVLVLDPPRKGCDEALLEDIVKYEPKKIVYVSCNSATLARDVKYLEENGYKVREVQPVDMFARSGHVECIALIQRETM